MTLDNKIENKQEDAENAADCHKNDDVKVPEGSCSGKSKTGQTLDEPDQPIGIQITLEMEQSIDQPRRRVARSPTPKGSRGTVTSPTINPPCFKNSHGDLVCTNQ